MQAQGKIVQCIGAVVDVEFPRNQMPKIYDALKMDGTALTLEVQQQLGDGVVRTIALGSSDGLRRGLMVSNTGNPITVPVGKATLGRIMDVLGAPIDERGPVKAMLDAYANGELSAVYLCYNKFISTMAQQPTIDQLLPLSADKMEAETKASGTQHGWDYLYEPDAQAVIDDLLVRYAEALVYQAVAENMASEHAARMVAMKAATDNAGNVIGELKLVYNKTRQAAITKELSEIVSGAAAISG